MNAYYSRIANISLRVGIIAAAALALYYIGLPLISLLLPFIIAGIVAILMEPLVHFFQTKLKLGRKLSSLFSLISVLIVFGTLVALAIYKIIVELAKLSTVLPTYFKSINLYNEALYWSNISNRFYLKIPKEAAGLLQQRLDEAVNSISLLASGLVTSSLTFVLNVIKVLPESFIFIIITILATYFISSDREKIRNFVFRQFPDSWAPKISSIKNDLFYALIGFLKAQLMLITISMFIASTGLTVIRAEYAVTLGIIIGISEIIPVVGTGTFFLPWALYELITRDISMFFGLLAVWILGVVIRQLMEPKILGVQIGIYPLVALISIYVGLELLGVFGMILGPVIVILLRNLNKAGVIHLWKE